MLLVGHVLDHTLRQAAGDQQLSGIGNAPAVLGLVATFASLGLLLARWRHAVAFAAVLGVGTALGFAAVHLLPEWSLFSDPYLEREQLDAASWIQMLTTLAAGALVGYEALRARHSLV